MSARSLGHKLLEGSRLAGENGMAMPLALMTLLLLGALVSALLGLGVAEPQIAANLVRGNQALNLSEGGAERSVNFFVQTPGLVELASCSPCPGAATAQWANVSLANLGTYTVNYQAIGDKTIEIVSIGQTTGGTATRTTRAILTMQPLPYAILSDRADLTGNASVNGNVQGNSALSLQGSSEVTAATTAAPTCTGCTSATHVTSVALSGAGKPPQDIKAIEPQSLRPYADYILGKEIGGILLPLITIVATGETVFPGSGSMAGWSVSAKVVNGTVQWQYKCCSGGTTPANGTYYTASEIDITSSFGPWQATLIAGTTAGTGVIDMSGGPTITPAGNPHVGDLVLVAGSIDITGNAQLTGAIAAKDVDINGNLNLTGNIVATGTVEMSGSATITYKPPHTPGLAGPLRVLAWSNF